MLKLVRWNFILSGHVQHVGLRFRAKQIARQFGLTGWIRNLDDGTVELELQGEQDCIDRFLYALQRLPGIRFSIVQADEIEPCAEKRFGIR